MFDILRGLTDPEQLIRLLSQVAAGWPGYLFLAAVVFAESGLLVGLFLPGDSFLFIVGVLAAGQELDISKICIVLVAASIAGDQCGYFLGSRTGPVIFSRPDSRWFKQEHAAQAHEFYNKHGGKALIYAKFVPVVRAFVPFIAGVAKMEYLRFAAFNVWGGIGWVLSMILAGYLFGDYAPIRRNLEKAVLGIVFLSICPMIVQRLRSRFSAKA